MNKYITKIAGATLLLIGMAGCAVTPEREAVTALTPWEQIAPAQAQQRAEQLKKLLAPWSIRGIGLQLNSYPEDLFPVDKLVSRVVELGFNCIYIDLSSEWELNSHLSRLVTAAAKQGVGVNLKIAQRDFYHRHRMGGLTRKFWIRTPDLSEVLDKIIDFNDALPEVKPDRQATKFKLLDGKLIGVTVLVEPHFFDGVRRSLQPCDLPYLWRQDTFGVGLENDHLMKYTLQMLEKLRAQAQGKLWLTVAIPDFYQELVADQKLSCGGVRDFAQISSTVMIYARGNKPSELYKRTQDEVAALPAGTRAVIAVKMAGHTSVTAGALRRRNWFDLLRATNYVLRKYRNSPVQGIVLAPLPEIDFLRLQEE